MKIGINLRLLTPGKIGGHEVYTRELMEYMLKIDEDVEYLLFVTDNNTDSLQFDNNRVRKYLIDHRNYSRGIRNALKDEMIDLYFCPLLVLEPLVIDVPCVFNIPDIQHEFFPEFFPSEILKWRNTYLPLSVTLSDAILTVSEFSKQTIIDKFKVEKNKVHAIYHAAEDIYKKELDPMEKERVKRKYNLPEQFGFYPANTWPHKNHKNLILSMDVYRKKYGEPPEIILTGSESEGHRELMKLIKKYNLERYIKYLGYIDKEKMPYIYGNAEFLVFPSLFEGFGLPVLEAMQMGCPVICSNTTSLPEVGGDAVLYFDPSDPEDIAEKMHSLITDTGLQRLLIEKGKRQAKKFFSWDIPARKTLEVLRRVSKVTSQERAGKYPLVSVVTPSFNQGSFIEETIKSVLSQDYPNIEYIVIDGGSTDNTVEILKQYRDKVRWLSEPDRGQADAVNKGFKMAKGEILGWLNSDDTYNPGAVSAAVEHFLTNPELFMVYGEGYFIDREGHITGKYNTETFNLQRLADICYICQPTVFLRNEVVEKIGMLDVNLDTCMDFDYWIRIGNYFDAIRIAYLKGEFLANSRMYDENKTFGMREKVYEEIMDTVKKHFGYVSNSWIYGYMHEIILKKKLKKYEDANLIIKSLLRFYYVTQLFGRQWGWIYFWRYLRDTLRYLTGRYYFEPQRGTIYQDGWVSSFYSVSLKNQDGVKRLLLAGRHLWPYRDSLKIRVIINGDELDYLNIKQKGRFRLIIDLPEKYKSSDILKVVLKPNKTFVPLKHGINNDRRRLSFILEKMELC